MYRCGLVQLKPSHRYLTQHASKACVASSNIAVQKSFASLVRASVLPLIGKFVPLGAARGESGVKGPVHNNKQYLFITLV